MAVRQAEEHSNVEELRVEGPGVEGPEAKGGSYVVFYDGVCALCNGVVRFLIRRDELRQLRYASLQSELADRVLTPHGIDPRSLSAMVLLRDPEREQTVVQGPRAVLEVLALLGGPYRLLGTFQILPDFILDLGYGAVAKTRYRVFGKYESCPLPTPENEELFLDT
jgi:predicted DCC family thiol-disulfide oxidoreductase YuxK